MAKKFFQNHSLVILISFIIVIFGVIKFLTLPVALYPRTSKPVLTLSINYTAIKPASFREEHGQLIETSLKKIPTVEKVLANYNLNRANYRVEFDWGIEPDDATTEVLNAIAGVRSRWPREWRVETRFSDTEGAMIFTLLTSQKLSMPELARHVKDKLSYRLEAIAGIESVWFTRYDQNEVLIELKPERLSEFGILPNQVYQAIKQREFDDNLGKIEYDDGTTQEVIFKNQYQNVQELLNTPILIRNGKQIYLRDVANAKTQQEELSSFYRGDGKRGVLIGATLKPDANIAESVSNFKSTINNVATHFVDDIVIDDFLDPSVYINTAIKNIVIAVLIGVMVTTLVIFLFFSTIAHTLIIATTIPLSLLGGFVLMNFIGIELNLVSLGAMALASGMVVDGAIVVLENTIRHYEESEPSNYLECLQVVLKSVSEVRNPVIASTLSTLIVFLPLTFTAPLAAAILGDLAKVVVCVLFMAMIVSLLFLPSFILLFGPNLLSQSKTKSINRLNFMSKMSYNFRVLVEKLRSVYLSYLKSILTQQSKSRLFLMASILLFIGSSLLIIFATHKEVMPIPHTDKVYLGIRYLNEEYEIDKSEEIINKIEEQLIREYGKYIARTLTSVEKLRGRILIYLKDKSKVDEFKAIIEQRFTNTPLTRHWVFPWSPTSLRIPNPPVISVNVVGSDYLRRLDTLEKIVDIIDGHYARGRMDQQPNAKKQNIFSVEYTGDFLSLVNPDLSREFNPGVVRDYIYNSLNKREVMKVEMAGEEMPLKIEYPKKFIQSSSDIKGLVLAYQGKYLPMSQFVDIESKRRNENIAAENSELVSKVDVWTRDSFKKQRLEIRKQMEHEIKSHPDLDQSSIEFVDSDYEIRDNINSLMSALVFSLLFIAILICWQFSGIIQSLIIMLAIPLGVIGVGFALFVFDTALSVNSMLGLILLSGTAVNNSIVFVDFFNKLYEKSNNNDIVELIMETARLRFRPIIITTMTTVLAMMPIALGMGDGGEIMQPLGIAVCGGLAISTFLTIFVIPIALMFYYTKIVSTGIIEKIHNYFLKLLRLALLLVIVSLSLNTNLFANKMDLPTVEKLALDNYRLNHDAKLAFEKADADFKATFSDFLPNLVLRNQRDYQNNDSTSGFDRVSRYSSFGLRYNLTAPVNSYFSSKAANEQKKQTKYAMELTEVRVLSLVRMQYFKLLRSLKDYEIYQKSLEISERHLKISTQRFKSGLVDESAMIRAQVLKKEVDIQVFKISNLLKIDKQNLLFMIGQPIDGEIDVIRDLWPVEFKYFKSDIKSIFENYSKDHNLELKQAQASYAAAEYQAQSAFISMFPNVFADYSYVNYSGDRSANFKDGSTFTMGIEWQIPIGGKDYFSFKSRLATKSIAMNQVYNKESEYLLNYNKYLQNLNYLKDNFSLTKDSLIAWEKISKQSERKFSLGAIDSFVVDQDIERYLKSQIDHNQVKIDILAQILEVCELFSDSKLFYDLF